MDSIETIQPSITEIDRMEAKILTDMQRVDLPVRHMFTPGLYTRLITIPSGTWASTMVHKTEHPFVVLEGIVQVFDEQTGEEDLITAPFLGITRPGTRRVLYAHTEVIWATFHVNPDDEKDPDKIGEKIVEHYQNPLIDNNDPDTNLWRSKRPELKAGEL